MGGICVTYGEPKQITVGLYNGWHDCRTIRYEQSNAEHGILPDKRQEICFGCIPFDLRGVGSHARFPVLWLLPHKQDTGRSQWPQTPKRLYSKSEPISRACCNG